MSDSGTSPASWDSSPPHPAGSVRDLVEQCLTDQRQRSQRGESFLVEVYLARHPELRSETDGVLDLIYSELVLREARGEKPALKEYIERFPELADQLQIQFEVERAIEP